MLNSTYKKNQAEKNGDKNGKALYKLMNNTVYGKTMENFRNRINVKLVTDQKRHLNQAMFHIKYLTMIWS